MTYDCPKGHASTESDFCSDCGTKIGGTKIAGSPADLLSPPIASSLGLEACPDCTTPHDPLDGKFCEICGYNFETRQSSSVEIPPIEIPPLDPAFSSFPDPSELGLTLPETQPTKTWTLRIEIDPTLAAPESPPAIDQAPITLPLTKLTNLIGRHNTAKAIVPDIPLDFDDAVSSRHALLTIQPDGQLILRDIGSSNGTMIDNGEVKSMQDYPILNGGSFTLGHWTRITAIET
jgi:FHA domain